MTRTKNHRRGEKNDETDGRQPGSAIFGVCGQELRANPCSGLGDCRRSKTSGLKRRTDQSQNRTSQAKAACQEPDCHTGGLTVQSALQPSMMDNHPGRINRSRLGLDIAAYFWPVLAGLDHSSCALADHRLQGQGAKSARGKQENILCTVQKYCERFRSRQDSID